MKTLACIDCGNWTLGTHREEVDEIDESAALIVEVEVHECQVCGTTMTIVRTPAAKQRRLA